MKHSLITTIAFLFIFSSACFSQEHFKRDGLTYGFSMGAAYSVLTFPEKKQSENGFALDLKIGYMLKQNLAILLTTNVSIYNYSGFGRNRQRDFGVLGPSVQYWPIDRLWFLGGIGLGGDNPVFWDIRNPDTDPLETIYYNGFGLVAASGYEMFQNNACSVDIKGKILYRSVKMKEGLTSGFSPSILIGINFY